MYNYYESIKWVQGINGAKSYQLMPNSNVVLMDSENENVFYIKSSDNLGMCKIRTFKYEEVIEQEKPKEYVTRDEIKEILKELQDEQTISRTKQQSVKEQSSNAK